MYAAFSRSPDLLEGGVDGLLFFPLFLYCEYRNKVEQVITPATITGVQFLLICNEN